MTDPRILDENYLDEVIRPRRRDTHKGDYGRVLVIGGSVGLTGAPQLAAEGALRVGAGLVSMSAPDCVYPIMAGGLREVMCFPVPSSDGFCASDALPLLLDRAAKCDAVVLGPGLGRSEQSDRLVLELIAKLESTLILDADGINAAATNIDVLRERKARTVLTPHDVEFQRLGGSLAEGRLAGARRLAADLGAVVVLKGSRSIVAHPDGTAFISHAGNPGMATGGSGDVLAGVIAGLAAQGLSPLDAAAAGVYLHATVGDLAADELGEFGMLPSDLLRKLPLMLKRFRSRD